MPVDGTNLAIRAARLLAPSRPGTAAACDLTIDKHVPVAGGMGGGSADAAATLLAVRHPLGHRRSGRDELLRLAAELGADVPFAFAGGTAVGTGRGDELSPALAKGSSTGCSPSPTSASRPRRLPRARRAPERHRADISPARQPVVDTAVLQALRAGDPGMLADAVHNDLQAPALHLQPGLARRLELGRAQRRPRRHVSGSGPTVAFLAPDLDGALELQIALSAARLTVVRATGPVHGARVVAD